MEDPPSELNTWDYQINNGFDNQECNECFNNNVEEMKWIDYFEWQSWFFHLEYLHNKLELSWTEHWQRQFNWIIDNIEFMLANDDVLNLKKMLNENDNWETCCDILLKFLEHIEPDIDPEL